jgi:triosephosphate isomerase
MLIAGNWKMNLLPHEGMLLTHDICEGMKSITPETEILICPPFTHLAQCSVIIESNDATISLGAQNCDSHEFGAYTGEVSPLMLASMGVEYVIIGHSERRVLFNESNEIIAHKCHAVLKAGMIPIICIGETLEERNAGNFEGIVREQLLSMLKNEAILESILTSDIVIAYEPVWAIGTGLAADPNEAENAHKFIRSILNEYLPGQSDMIRILYGGSVKPENASAYFAMPNIDGALIGGASLNMESFLAIAQSA